MEIINNLRLLPGTFIQGNSQRSFLMASSLAAFILFLLFIFFPFNKVDLSLHLSLFFFPFSYICLDSTWEIIDARSEGYGSKETLSYFSSSKPSFFFSMSWNWKIWQQTLGLCNCSIIFHNGRLDGQQTPRKFAMKNLPNKPEGQSKEPVLSMSLLLKLANINDAFFSMKHI